MNRRKSLLIGINYTGSRNELHGCQQDTINVAEFLYYRGYPQDNRSQVILRDDLEGAYFPSGHNILAAMDWLVSEPNTCCFLHYSGHGGQVHDRDASGVMVLNDTIVPVDFEMNGQIDSGTLHEHLVSALHPSSTLFILLDCCHSGSAAELPYVYRSDDDGNINLMDNLKMGVKLFDQAGTLIQGGFTFDKFAEARELYAGATSFFRGLRHMGDEQDEGLGEDRFTDDWKHERKFVTMFSGCRDDQTSADATISNVGQGAMSWAFLETMKRIAKPTYVDTLQHTRALLKQSHYTQIPQLSTGIEFDLDSPMQI